MTRILKEKTNRGKRRISTLNTRKLLRRYRHGVPQERQSRNNGGNPYIFKIVRPNGEIVSLKPIPLDSPIRGGRSDITVYAGYLPIDALPHLYSQ